MNPIVAIGESVALFIGIGGTFAALLYIWWTLGLKGRMEEIEDELRGGRKGMGGKEGKRMGLDPGEYLKIKAIAFFSAVSVWPLAIFGASVMIWLLRFATGLKYVLLQFITDPAIVEKVNAFFVK